MMLRNKNGWTIIQTMILAAVIALFLVFSFSGILSLRKSLNESRVKNILKSLAAKLLTHKLESSRDSYPDDLSFIENSVFKNVFKKPLISGELSFEYSGYWFIYAPGSKDALGNISRYTFFSKPVQYNVFGFNSFVMNEGATVYIDKGKYPAVVDKFDCPVM
ncbi:MAG: hypothetical protein V1739_00850 [Candidatus Omnitrophota bacterium]